MKAFHYGDDSLSIHHTVTPIPDIGEFHMHAHRNCELYYFLEGSGYYTVEGTDYPLQKGAVIVMRDGEAHTPHIDPSVSYDRISINFPRDFLPAADGLDEIFYNRPLGKDNMFLLPEPSHAFVFKCMENICEEDHTVPTRSRAAVYLQALIWELLRIKKSGKTLIPDEEHSDASAAVRRILTYINENLTTVRNIEMLEKELFFSRSYINRIFKESTGSSVWSYILLKRLLLAQTLLQNGKPAAIVATECGFEDYSSFYRQFKKRFGCSPLDARKKQ